MNTLYLKSRFVVLTFVAMLGFFANGCASFRGKEIPTYTYEQIKIISPIEKPSIDYDAKSLDFAGREVWFYDENFYREIKEVFSKSNVFQRFRPRREFEKYHFTMTLQNKGNLSLALLSGFISGSTLFIIPGYARDEFILTVDVKKEGQIIKKYQYRNYMHSWVHIIFMFFLTDTNHPRTIRRDVIDNMLLNFLHDLEKDEILK